MSLSGSAFLYQLAVTLRLHFRNRMALLYSYAFPTIFLVVFWVLYRNETQPLAGHLGELLTVTALGGACFGLPTSLVAERERGVWRRFRLTPASTATLLATTAVARYLLLLIAALLQVGLAMTLFGMPAPEHPLDLLAAFTLVAFAFIGVGLLIATVADNVPAVQALGQCIFLPMLVIGGIAVRIESLPTWAQHLSAYFPGRYAVAALQVSATGDGLRSSGFAVLALLMIGAAGCFAGLKLFRWDQQQRFVRLEGKGWAAAALGVWAVVGVLAQATGQIAIGVPRGADAESLLTILESRLSPEERQGLEGETPAVALTDSTGGPGDTIMNAPASGSADTSSTSGVVEATAPGRAGREPQPWDSVGLDAMRQVNFAALPPDQGVISPVASLSEEVLPDTRDALQCVHNRLAEWGPGRVADPVQRVRNYLYIAVAADIAQMPELERALPLVIFDYLETTVPSEDLPKILYWVAANPDEGDESAVQQLPDVCLQLQAPGNRFELRVRTQYYALKLLGRLIGAIPRG